MKLICLFIFQSDLIEPIITPRFALSCCEKTMEMLGQLAEKYNCRIQVCFIFTYFFIH